MESVEKKEIPPNKVYPQVLAVMSCFFCQITTGTTLGWISPSLVQLQGPDSPIPTTPGQGSTIASIMVVGGALSPIIFAYVVDLFGRRWMAFMGSIFFTISWIIMIFSTEVYHIYIGRIVVGFGVGFTFGLVPIYIGEIAEKHIRSLFGIGAMMMMSLGTLFEYALGPNVDFKTMNIVSIIFPILSLGTFLCMPESPYHLMRMGNKREAEKTLMWLRGQDDPQNVSEELAQIVRFVEDSPKRPYKETVKELNMLSNKMAVLILTVLMIAQQFSGNATVKSYFHIIIKETETPLDPFLTVLVVEIVGLFVSLVSMFVIERFGRRIMFLCSCFGCILSTSVTGLYFMLRDCELIDKSGSWMALGGLFALQVFNNSGVFLVPVIIASEMSTASIRSWYGGYKSIINSVFNSVSAKVFQVMKDDVGPQYAFWLFSVIALACWAITFFILPETKGKTLEEIQDILNRRKSKRKTDNIVMVKHIT